MKIRQHQIPLRSLSAAILALAVAGCNDSDDLAMGQDTTRESMSGDQRSMMQERDRTGDNRTMAAGNSATGDEATRTPGAADGEARYASSQSAGQESMRSDGSDRAGQSMQRDGSRGSQSAAGSRESERRSMAGGDSGQSGAAGTVVVMMTPTRGSDTEGRVAIIEQDVGLLLDVKLRGLEPGKHGFHVHEDGNCAGPNASAAGGHFDPNGMPHGGPDEGTHHRGDLGNIVADAQGRVDTRLEFSELSMTGSEGILGHSLVLHKQPDDLETQPSGGSGDKIACGVIERTMGRIGETQSTEGATLRDEGVS